MLTLEGYRTDAQTKNVIAHTKTLVANLKQIKQVTAAYDGPIGGILGYIKAIMSALGLNVGVLTGLRR